MLSAAPITTATTSSTATRANQLDSATAMFELSESSFDQFISQAMEDSKPRQILGESVFSQFIKTEDGGAYEFPMVKKVDVPELSPSVGTVTPLQLHSSIVESVFSPSIVDTTPLFDDVELDADNWKPLFEPSEMVFPKPAEPRSFSAPVTAAATTTMTSVSPSLSPEPLMSIVSSIATPAPSAKRSASEAGFMSSSSDEMSGSEHKRRESSSVRKDDLDVVPYNRKTRVTPLSPINYDDKDPVAQKRARNTEAARRSRARKLERMSQLEDKVQALNTKNQELEAEVARLRSMLALRG